jgi:hybrid cluster-associated redox disulfide protein
MARITGKTNLGELIQKYPKAAQVLAEDYALYCVGCLAARFDTLEEGARRHGMKDKEIKTMIKKLNNLRGSKR